jgi:hypothetical protein
MKWNVLTSNVEDLAGLSLRHWLSKCSHFFPEFSSIFEVDVIVTMAFPEGLEWYLGGCISHPRWILSSQDCNDIVDVNEVIESMKFNGGNEAFLETSPAGFVLEGL